MKKIISFLVLFLICSLYLSAQNIENIVEKIDRQVSLKIEYLPELDEARITYSCPEYSFDAGEAIKTIKERTQNFTKEKNYYFYTYLRKDVTRFDNQKNIAYHTSFIKFLK